MKTYMIDQIKVSIQIQGYSKLACKQWTKQY